MKHTLISTLITLVFAQSGYLSAQDNTQNEILPKDFTAKAFSHIEYLAGMGHRQVGSENDAKTVQYITDQFKQMDVDVQVQPFEFQSYEYSRVILEIGGKKIKVTGLGINPYNNSNFQKSEGVPILIDVNKNDGKISSNETEGRTIISKDWNSHFQLLMYRPGIIIYIDPVQFDKLQGTSNLYYKLNIQGGMKKFHSANVVAKIGKDPSREILITAHFDTYKKNNPGASDNASGIAVMLELANYFKKMEKDLNCTIKFVAFGGEEAGLLGSRHYLKENPESIKRCELLFNLDDVGGNKSILVEMNGSASGTPEEKGKSHIPDYLSTLPWEGINSPWRMLPDAELMKIFCPGNHPAWLVNAVRKTVKELGYDVKFTGTQGSDQTTFAQAGIVTSGIGIVGDFPHSLKDIPAEINRNSLRKAGEIAAHVIINTLNHFKKSNSGEGDSLSLAETSLHLRFLASDELMGRKPGTYGAEITARYIAEQFRTAGLKKLSNADDYFQNVDLSNNVKSKNIIGYVEGTNPELKNEYVLLCAHYDHLGSKAAAGEADSIYNGARDNAMGVAALISAAKTFSRVPAVRSILFIAFTGEEEGMIGSKYFINNPLVPLKQIVFVLNNDGGGFNDTTLIRVAGLEKVKQKEVIKKSTDKYNLKTLPYPAKFEYLHELSDNFPFYRKGIPAITFSPGFDAVDEKLLKYIHTVKDQVGEDFNFNYLLKFTKAYIHTARMIADSN